MLRNAQTERIFKKCGTISEPGGDLVNWGHEKAQSFESAKRGRGAKGGLEGHGKIVLHARLLAGSFENFSSISGIVPGKKKKGKN